MTAVRERAESDAGFTLIEVLIAMVILGIGFTALLAAMGVAFSGATSFRQQSDAGGVALSAAERVKGAAYVNCATTSTYQSTARAITFPSTWGSAAVAQLQVTVTSVQYWDGTKFASANACLDATSSLLRLQLVTVQAVSPDTRAIESLIVVKRDAS